MNKRAQVLIVSLWILIILTILAVSIGHRVSFALRISRYQRDKLKALYLAKAGINRAIVELNKDTNSYDALNEPWSDNEELFKKIMLDDNQTEFATVSYTILDEDKKPKNIYGVTDEERKLNINTASRELFIALLEKLEINPAQEIADNIRVWRGDTDIPDLNEKKMIYEDLGYPCKADKFTNIEELTLVKDITPEDLQRMKEYITVYGESLININTVSPEVLNIFTRGIAKELSIGENFADSVVTKLIELRNSKGYFETKNDITITLTGDEETNIFNNLTNNLIFRANNFLIEVAGNVSTIKSKLVVVYNRAEKGILYWHEG